jgi:hypothetical protein
MFGGRGEGQARKYLPRLSDAGVVPEVLGWVDGGVLIRRGLPLPNWVAGAEPAEVVALRPLLIDLLQRLHAEGVCHRDLHWENVVIVGRAPFVIDLEHACDVDPAGPCYDMTGPFAGVPLPPAHAQFGGILGTQGMWWDADWDRRWDGRYRPLGQVFGPLMRGLPQGTRG